MRRTERDDGFRAFFGREAEGVRRFAWYLTGDVERAEDLAQEALARAYAVWGRIAGGSPGAYARKTVANLVRNDHRRLAVARRRAPSPPPDVPDHAPGVEDAVRLAAALRTLTPTQRAAVVLRFYEDRSEADVSRILGRPVGTVKSDLHRALGRLRPLLEEAREAT